MIIMIDNYDSFTYNLVQYLEQIGTSVKVVRNDAASISDLISWNPAGIVISPGPGRPETAGLSQAILNKYKHASHHIPITNEIRCLNLSTTVGIALYESLRR